MRRSLFGKNMTWFSRTWGSTIPYITQPIGILIAHVVLPRITLLWSSDVSMHSTDWATATDAGTAGSSFRMFALVLSGQEASTSSVNSYILVDSLELRWLNKMGKGITAASTILPKKQKHIRNCLKHRFAEHIPLKGGNKKRRFPTEKSGDMWPKNPNQPFLLCMESPEDLNDTLAFLMLGVWKWCFFRSMWCFISFGEPRIRNNLLLACSTYKRQKTTNMWMMPKGGLLLLACQVLRVFEVWVKSKPYLGKTWVATWQL